MEIVRLGGALGAEIRGVRLDEVDDATFAVIERAWLDHLVLRFRDQSLDLDAQLAFSRRFGEPELAPVNVQGRPWIDGYPQIAVMSNIVENGRRLGSLGSGEAGWHTDMSYRDAPPSASLLYAVEIPADGSGDTGFANMYLAWERLPDDLRERVAGLTIVHDASRNSADEQRAGMAVVTDPREAPGARHPAVRVHPVTGRPALFLGRRRNAWAVGLALDDSEALLDRLWAHATRPEFTWHHRWRVGDVLVWDNRCTIHRRDAIDPAMRRLLRRTQMAGDRPRAPAPDPHTPRPGDQASASPPEPHTSAQTRSSAPGT